MEKALTVLMIEDDNDQCNEYKRILDISHDIHLVGVTNNEKEALKGVMDYLPDVIILDIELHKGSGNGIAFLEGLNNMKMKVAPFILVTTYNISLFTHEIIRQLGADFIMVKSQDDYSAESVIIFLRSLKLTIQDMRKKFRSKNNLPLESPADIIKRQKSRITVEMDRIGISPKATGRCYLIDAIVYKIEGKHEQAAAIAKKYQKSVASVERAMQNAINKAWNTTPSEDLAIYYTSRIHPEKGVPTVTEFICHYANRLKTEYQ